MVIFVGVDPALRGKLSTSPSAITALAWLRILALEAAVLDHQFEGAAEHGNRRPSTLRVAQMRLAVGLAAAHSDPSTTSSWRSVAVWMNSTAAASLWGASGI